jgi:hypothetical protein
MEDAFHCSANGLVVGVDGFWVVRSDEIKGRSIAAAIALTAIGADTEIGRATP